MVFNSFVLVWVVESSASSWQRIACISDPFTSEELLDLLCCFPLQQLGRFALCLWDFLCFAPADSYYYYYYSSSTDSESSSSTTDYD